MRCGLRCVSNNSAFFTLASCLWPLARCAGGVPFISIIGRFIGIVLLMLRRCVHLIGLPRMTS